MSEETAQVADCLTVALLHSLRAWVDTLESILRPRPDLEIIAAHTDPQWVQGAVTTGRASVLLVQVEDQHDLVRLVEPMLAGNDALGVVALSESRDAALLSAALRGGVRGWIEPTAPLEHLVTVLHGVGRRETWYPPDLLTMGIASLVQTDSTRHEATSLLTKLSPRESEILDCLVRGLGRDEIAEEFVLSPHTVRTHINNVLHKLEVHSTLAAVSLARRSGTS